MFRPAKAVERQRIRAQYGTTDYFVIGMNAANMDPVRKGFQEALMSFALFRADHPDSVLLLHTREDSKKGLDLEILIREAGEIVGHQGDLRDWVWLSSQYKYMIGTYSPEDIAKWTQGLDVYLMNSYAEGFGLPPLEAQACGVPVVCSVPSRRFKLQSTAISEICQVGWRAEAEPFWHYKFKAWWIRPSVYNVYQALKMAYEARESGEMAELGKKARQFALSYDADLVADLYWKPVLRQLMAD
jgi:glycosyltransferase involved in cell wall biosynthesis